MRYALLAISCLFLFPISAHATAYYVSWDSASTTNCRASNDGLATTSSFCTLDRFTENARSAGDIVFVRRGFATTSAITDLDFTSDGTISNPIIITADYDNLWGDFASSSQTYTVNTASSTFVGSASTTGIVAGDWVYAEGDCFETYNSTSLNQCDLAYEVASIAPNNVLNLYFPYKGNQTGSGLTLRKLGKNPQWNVASGNFQWNFDTDDYWLVKGMDIRGTDANGNIEIDSSLGHAFIDTILTGNDSSVDIGINATDAGASAIIKKVRTLGSSAMSHIADTWRFYQIDESLFDGNAVAAAIGIQHTGQNSADVSYFISNSFFRGFEGLDIGYTSIFKNKLRNTYLLSTTTLFVAANDGGGLFFEDYNGTIGDNRAHIQAGVSQETSTYFSTSTLRSGGGPTAMEIRPTSSTTNIWDFNRIKLFEYPIYTDTSSKQYDVYFRTATTTAEWTANPTASQFWIQCEYWAHDTGATSTRKVKKSTGTVDFAGSSAWQALSVTCDPSQSGILYLSGYYAKTQESGQTNYFLMDNTPIIQ